MSMRFLWYNISTCMFSLTTYVYVAPNIIMLDIECNLYICKRKKDMCRTQTRVQF